MRVENIKPRRKPAKISIAGRVELTNGWHTAVLVNLGKLRALDTVRGIAELPELDIVGNVKSF